MRQLVNAVGREALVASVGGMPKTVALSSGCTGFGTFELVADAALFALSIVCKHSFDESRLNLTSDL